jgi:hypothetical protein
MGRAPSLSLCVCLWVWVGEGQAVSPGGRGGPPPSLPYGKGFGACPWAGGSAVCLREQHAVYTPCLCLCPPLASPYAVGLGRWGGPAGRRWGVGLRRALARARGRNVLAPAPCATPFYSCLCVCVVVCKCASVCMCVVVCACACVCMGVCTCACVCVCPNLCGAGVGGASSGP